MFTFRFLESFNLNLLFMTENPVWRKTVCQLCDRMNTSMTDWKMWIVKSELFLRHLEKTPPKNRVDKTLKSSQKIFGLKLNVDSSCIIGKQWQNKLFCKRTVSLHFSYSPPGGIEFLRFLLWCKDHTVEAQQCQFIFSKKRIEWIMWYSLVLYVMPILQALKLGDFRWIMPFKINSISYYTIFSGFEFF